MFLTYNDHWTPVGHEVVAEAIHEFVKSRADQSVAVHTPPLDREPAGPTRTTEHD